MCVGLLSGSLVLAPLTAVADGPVGATLQTEGNAGLAAAGNVLPAKLSVVVTKSDGRPATGFAPNGNHVLPAGWRLDSDFNGPPGGCGIVPIAFTNVGAGIYTIDVLPAGCPFWVAGEHHYMVSLSKNGRRGGDEEGKPRQPPRQHPGDLRGSSSVAIENPGPP
jgi:hypothetical protein